MKSLAVDLNLTQDRYDNSTYWGRFKNMMDITSPSTLFTTEEQIQEARTLVDTHMNGDHHQATEVELWRAKQVLDSCVHPDTGETIFPLFRMSAFMPTNVLLCYGLLLPNPATTTVLAAQWINQSYNLAVNYANANKTNELNLSQIGGAYAAAVVASCSIAVGLGMLVRKGKVPKFLSPVVPYTAVASAGMLNCSVMRWNEVQEGIKVRDAQGNVLGVSQAAGRQAVELSAFSRAVWSIPALAIPPAAMAVLSKLSWFTRNPRLHTPAQLLTIGISLYFGVPAAVGLFPREMSIEPSKLEDKFQGLRDGNGEPIEMIYYSKGM